MLGEGRPLLLSCSAAGNSLSRRSAAPSVLFRGRDLTVRSAFSLILRKENPEKWDKIAQIKIFVPLRAASLYSWLHLRDRNRLHELKSGTKRAEKGTFCPISADQKRHEAMPKTVLTRKSPSEGARSRTKNAQTEIFVPLFPKTGV